MIDLIKARKEFKKYIDNYNNQDDPGFNLKIVHTYHVVDNAMMIAKELGLTEEDINLAGLIAILHDIGRFDELKNLKKFDSVGKDGTIYLYGDEGIIDITVDDTNTSTEVKEKIK
ncbi:MAG: HD domain-containing protein [Bacilli bacterium]|nr:HD domain-containing protein [Bacilli bacterium]